MGAAIRDGVVALAGVVSAVGDHRADLFADRDLAEQIGQDRCITDVAAGDLDSANLQCLLIDPKVDLAPDPPLGPAMLAGVPLAFALDLDPGAVDQQVQRPLGAAIRDAHGQVLLTAGQGAEVGHRPVETDQPQQALDEPASPWSLGPVAFPWLDLPERHAEQHLHRQAGLDSCIAVSLLAATPACRRGIPAHFGVEPDCQRAPALERFIVGRPVPGLVGRGYGSARASQLPPWIRDMNPSRDLCNRAPGRYQLSAISYRHARADAFDLWNGYAVEMTA